jgi:hypothetical protein
VVVRSQGRHEVVIWLPQEVVVAEQQRVAALIDEAAEAHG